jgi:hypothetical protein
LRGSQAGHSRKKSKGWSQITLTTSTRSLQLARRMQWAIVSKCFFFKMGALPQPLHRNVAHGIFFISRFRVTSLQLKHHTKWQQK